jgi:hypothetical protein
MRSGIKAGSILNLLVISISHETSSQEGIIVQEIFNPAFSVVAG